MGVSLRKLGNNLLNLSIDPGDTKDIRLRKFVLIAGYSGSVAAAIMWGLVYLFQGENAAGMVLLFLSVVSLIFLVLFIRTRNIAAFKTVLFVIYLVAPTFSMWFLGGFYNSSALIIWSLIGPILALLTADIKTSVRWFLAYLFLLSLSGVLQPYLVRETYLSSRLINIFFVLNLGSISVIVFFVIRYFITQKEVAYSLLALEQEKTEKLLLNVLPREIVSVLKENNETIAERFDAASVLFADLVGFTPLSVELEPVEMVELLNEIFSHFDALVEKYGLEKIRTIGDNYMVASGVPTPRPDHAHALANLALDMQTYVATYASRRPYDIKFRIGINSGSLVAGVIGKQKLHYDVWGDVVNTASRMESQGMPGKSQVTEETYALLRNDFVFQARGKIEIKGKGVMETWFLIRKNIPVDKGSAVSI